MNKQNQIIKEKEQTIQQLKNRVPKVIVDPTSSKILADQEKKIASNAAQIAALKAEIADLEAKIVAANKELPEEREVMIEQWDLAQKIKALIAENESLNTEIKDLLEKTELEKVKAKIFDSENEKQQAANEQTQAVLDKKLQKIADLNANIAGLQKQLGNLGKTSTLAHVNKAAADATFGINLENGL